ncbi:MAG: PHP domain-containing protein [Caldilineae bacterium]|nr:MAG: PHP domain-containing protein [Caldilineae bacterium]
MVRRGSIGKPEVMPRRFVDYCSPLTSPPCGWDGRRSGLKHDVRAMLTGIMTQGRVGVKSVDGCGCISILGRPGGSAPRKRRGHTRPDKPPPFQLTMRRCSHLVAAPGWNASPAGCPHLKRTPWATSNRQYLHAVITLHPAGSTVCRLPAHTSHSRYRPMVETLWRVELHCHSRYSPDSLTEPEEILAACRERGIDRIAITEHNTIEGARVLKEMAPDMVILGEEIRSTEGDIIGWFMQEEVPKGLSPDETIAALRAQNAVVCIPHPLDELRGGSALGREVVCSLIDRIDALEVFNSRCLRMADNDAAAALAREHGLLATAGSDAHTAAEIGRAVMIMPPFNDADSFRRSLALARIEGELSPRTVKAATLYAKIMQRLRRLRAALA